MQKSRRVMSVFGIRNFVCWMMIVLCPLSLSSADTGSAMLHSEGGVWVNGLEVAASTVVFPGDLLETKPGFVANLDAEGSSVLIQPESVVKFQGTFLVLEHGSVSVGTSTSMRVVVDCIKVEPVSKGRTQYEVTDFNGTGQVAARKSDVNIIQGGALQKASNESAPSPSATVHEGGQATRDEAAVCGAPLRPGAAVSGMNTKWLGSGAGAGGGGFRLLLPSCD